MSEPKEKVVQVSLSSDSENNDMFLALTGEGRIFYRTYRSGWTEIESPLE